MATLLTLWVMVHKDRIQTHHMKVYPLCSCRGCFFYLKLFKNYTTINTMTIWYIYRTSPLNKNILYRCQNQSILCNQKPNEKKDQACYIINDGKPKRRSVQQAAPTEYGLSGYTLPLYAACSERSELNAADKIRVVL